MPKKKSISNLKNVELGQIRAVSEKAQKLEEFGEDVIHLEIGEPDFVTPKHIREATQKALSDGKVHYSPNRGVLQLRELISSKLKTENSINTNPSTDIIVTQGAAEALYIAVSAHCGLGDEVLIIEPSFASYTNLVHLCGAIPISVPTYEVNDWIVDPKDIKNAITPKTKMIIINSPCNPTGAVYPKEILKNIANSCIENDLLVVSDEIYEKINYSKEKNVSIGSFDEMTNRVITINGFSKAYAMTGWRLGYVAASENLITNMLKVHQYNVTCVSTFSQYGAIAVYTEKEKSEAALQKMQAAYKKRRDIIYNGLKEIKGLTISLPKGAFYAFPNISQFNLSSTDFSKKLLNDTGVATVPGSVFSKFGEGNIRISYAAPEEELKEAVDRIQCFIEKL